MFTANPHQGTEIISLNREFAGLVNPDDIGKLAAT